VRLYHRVCACVPYDFSEYIAIISIYNIDHMVFRMKRHNTLCEEGPELFCCNFIILFIFKDQRQMCPSKADTLSVSQTFQFLIETRVTCGWLFKESLRPSSRIQNEVSLQEHSLQLVCLTLAHVLGGNQPHMMF
jgi:hypothetical protein